MLQILAVLCSTLLVSYTYAFPLKYIIWTADEHADVQAECDRLSSEGIMHCEDSYSDGAWGTLLVSEDTARQALGSSWNLEVSAEVQRASSGEELNCPWPLGRLCQRQNTGNEVYKYKYSGANTTVYVIDEFANVNHIEFRSADGTRQRISTGIKTTPGDDSCRDHATHVAGIIGGRTYGVAKDVEIVSMHAISCNSNTQVGYVVKALDWILHNAKRPAVAHMSLIVLGEAPSMSAKILQLYDAGFPVVVAGGNFRQPACNFTPAKMPQVFTVGNVDNFDKVNFQSNDGPCIMMFAPGTFIKSAAGENNTGYNIMTGTSQSAPHVTGAIAQLLEKNSSYTIEDIRRQLLGQAARGVIDNSTVIGGAPNLLLQIIK